MIEETHNLGITNSTTVRYYMITLWRGDTRVSRIVVDGQNIKAMESKYGEAACRLDVAILRC